MSMIKKKKKVSKKKPHWYYERRPIFVDTKARDLAKEAADKKGINLRDHVSSLITDDATKHGVSL